MRIWIKKWKNCFQDKKFIFSFILAWFLLLSSLVINYFAGTYATEKASFPVTDVILSNIPVMQVNWLFIYGPVIFYLFLALICFYHPNKFPFILKSLALFILVRALFISLTHIGPFPGAIITPTSNFTSKFNFGADLFFSGHTGAPFLMALIFWRNKILRYLFILTSIFLGIIVLLAHAHYSIDVLSAFFITYGIFHLSLFFFLKDWEYFQGVIK